MLMLPIGYDHIACVRRVNTLFHKSLLRIEPLPALVGVQNALRLSQMDNLIPDVILVRSEAQAEARAARADDVFLVVEVAVSSPAYDQGLKLRRYALHGIPEVWVAALERERVYVYREPVGEEYRTMQTRGRGDTLGIEALPEVGPFSVDDILGPAAASTEE